jgi:O-antigen/teichoic acid export membrane protein
MLLSGGALLILLHTDLLLLGLLATPNDVAIYGAATRIAYVNAFIFFAMSVLSVPQFSALLGQGRTGELQTFLRSVIRWTFWPSLLLVVGLLLLGKPLLELFGPRFVAGYPVLVILALASLFRACTGPIGELLAVGGSHDIAAAALWGGALANVVLNLVLIPAYGPVGAAVATSLAWVAIRCCFIVLVRRRLGVVPFLVGGA